MDKLGIVIHALQQGQEVELAGHPLRLFRAGDRVLLPSGWLLLDEDRMLRRTRRVRIRGIDQDVWMDANMPVDWLFNQVRALPDAVVQAIARNTTLVAFTRSQLPPRPAASNPNVVSLDAVRRQAG